MNKLAFSSMSTRPDIIRLLCSLLRNPKHFHLRSAFSGRAARRTIIFYCFLMKSWSGLDLLVE